MKGLEFEFSIKSTMTNLNPGHYDLEISYSRDQPANMDTVLFRELAILVCAPAERRNARDQYIPPSELITRRLIGATEDMWDWRVWSSWVGASWPGTPNFINVETDDMAIQAALSGAGIALCELRLIASKLASGLLVPACICKPMKIGYYTASAAGGLHAQVTSAVIAGLQRISHKAHQRSLAAIGQQGSENYTSYKLAPRPNTSS